MLIRERRRLRLTLALASALVLLLLCVRLAGPAATETLLGLQHDWIGSSSSGPSHSQTTLDGSVIRPSGSGSEFIGSYGEITGFAPPTTLRPGGGHPLHTEIFSVTTRDRKYFRIKFGSQETSNPNIIPHPQTANTWIVVAQRRGDDGGPRAGAAPRPSAELACNAMFIDDSLVCIGADGRGFGGPRPLPLAPTTGGSGGGDDDAARCTTGELASAGRLNAGPHDARVFYGPEVPYAIYGSQSRFTCFGQWIRDFRGLVGDWGLLHRPQQHHDVGGPGPGGVTAGVVDHEEEEEEEDDDDDDDEVAFTSPNGTELQRNPPYGLVEKNWFLFWDARGDRYVHFDITPGRSFARLHRDGSVGKDLALNSGREDKACLARYLPRLLRPDLESVHQATNSLSVTLCRRGDPKCAPDDENTFIFLVFHHKNHFHLHALYHPYVLVFRRSAPFEVWAVGTRPIWISGRNALPGGDTEMFYVTSMSWRAKGQRYHGYVDDVLFLAFGIEDRRTGGIDVFAGDLLANLGLC